MGGESLNQHVQHTEGQRRELAQVWTLSLSPLTDTWLWSNCCSRDSDHNAALDLHPKEHSRFNLLINGCRKVELGKSLPFLRCADAVIGQFFHCHSVNAFRVPDPVVHLQRHKGISVRVTEQELVFKCRHRSTINTIFCWILSVSLLGFPKGSDKVKSCIIFYLSPKSGSTSGFYPRTHPRQAGIQVHVPSLTPSTINHHNSGARPEWVS